jgi:hypothetical protein
MITAMTDLLYSLYQVTGEVFHTEQHGLESICGYHNYILIEGSHVHKSPVLDPTLSKKNPQFHHFNIILPSMPKYHKW